MLHYVVVILYLGEICFTGLIYFIVLIVSFAVLLNWIEFGLHSFQWEKRASVGFHNYFVIAYYLLCKGIRCSIDMVWLLWHGVLYLLQTLQTRTIKSCAFLHICHIMWTKKRDFFAMLLHYWLLCFSGGRVISVSKITVQTQRLVRTTLCCFQVVFYPWGLLETDYSVCCLVFMQHNFILIFVCVWLRCYFVYIMWISG